MRLPPTEYEEAPPTPDVACRPAIAIAVCAPGPGRREPTDGYTLRLLFLFSAASNEGDSGDCCGCSEESADDGVASVD